MVSVSAAYAVVRVVQQPVVGSLVAPMSTRLGDLRALRRDPAKSAPFPAGTESVLPPTFKGAPAKDPSGHTFSPAIRAQQRELNSKFAEAPERAAEAKTEFDRVYFDGFEARAAGDLVVIGSAQSAALHSCGLYWLLPRL